MGFKKATRIYKILHHLLLKHQIRFFFFLLTCKSCI